ncbi:MAG: Band 7 protein [Anaerolineaceae bacterium 4572_78]|nr:MAG: Band 7 protein [Anaerolineaceae bacterium 4572_78]
MSQMGRTVSQIGDTMSDIAESDEFRMNPQDFLSAKDMGSGSIDTRIEQTVTSLIEAAQTLNRSTAKQKESGDYVNVISPVVMPKHSRNWGWLWLAGFMFIVGIVGLALSQWAFVGPHYWILWVFIIAFGAWQNTYVMIPDGCKALITKWGKVVEEVGPGQKVLLDPWKKVSYVVNTTREYPYNAPIRQAPTQERVEASVDLFLQFRIEDPNKFIFTLGGSQGFSEKLQNAVSEVTRSLIYEQRAESIYDLVGESTQGMLDTLNNQFLPAVRFTSANITLAEPSSQKYRMDLAASEVIRVAKEAYTYEYELKLQKEQDEGELNKDLASLRETLSEIKAVIATYQAQIDTAYEMEINKANAYAKQLLIEAKSEAKANAALLEAQSLDIRAINSGRYPEILEYRYQKRILDKIESVSSSLPQVINVGPADQNEINLMEIAKETMGLKDTTLYTPKDIQDIRNRMQEIETRVVQRGRKIKELVEAKKEELGGDYGS